MNKDKDYRNEDDFNLCSDFPPFHMFFKAFPFKNFSHEKGFFHKNFGDLFSYGKHYPITHVKRDDEGYLIIMEIPGISKDQISLEVTNDSLWFNAKNDDLGKDYRYHMNFRKRIQTDNISAKLKAGILTIKALYLEPHPKRRVNID